VLSEFENTAKVNFFYSPNSIGAKRKISVNVKNKELKEVLHEIFTPLGIGYEIQGNRILLKKSNTLSVKNDENIESQAEYLEQAVSGTVADENGVPLVGVNISIKGTTKGAVTNDKGQFNINVPNGSSILVFSYIGYKKQEIQVGKSTELNIKLVAEQQSLDEVVVVGYGTQKKINLTGSVSSISAKEIADRPITQSSQALAGLMTGVSVSQGSGQPGNNGASITIRGIGSYGAGGGALILVDGLATSINDVDPNNIKSISVLKDAASAAMYGSRAANGVILIETKRGESGKMKISYNSYAGWQNATQLPDFVESAEYAKLRNEANINAGAGASYTDAEIEKFRNGSDPDNYPNVPHLKNLLTSGDGFQSNHNLSFMGGNDKTRYLFSIGYLQQNGIVAKNGYSKYNILLNTDTKIKDNLTLKVNLSGYTSENHSPRQYDGGMNSMINFAVREGPIYAGKKSDGTYGYQDNYSPEAWMASESFYKGTNKYFLGSSEIAWEVIKGLTLSGKVGYNFWSYYNKDYASEFVFNPNKTVGPNNLTVSSGQGQQLTMQSLATYTKQIDKHSFTILGGVSQEQYDDWGMSAYRKDFQRIHSMKSMVVLPQV
jgi:TonB-linked SusC/RagA family outer membrane protein